MEPLPLLATLIDFAGTLLLSLSAGTCLWAYLRRFGAPSEVDALRLRLAAGLVFALSVKTGAGIVRTATAATWQQVGWLVLVVGLRWFLGRVLKGQLARRAAGSP